MSDQNIKLVHGWQSEDGAYGYSQSEVEFKVRRMTQNRPNKQGQVKIEIEIEQYQYQGIGKYDRTRFYVNTNIWIDKGNWNNKTQKLSQKEEDYVVKSNKINKIFSAVQSFISSKGQQEIDDAYGESVNFSKVRAIFPGRKENRKTFFDLMIDYKSIRANDGDTGERTVTRIGTVANTIKAYDEYRNMKTYIEDINLTWSDYYNAWMVNTKKYAPGTIDRCYQIVCSCLEYYWGRKDELKLVMQDKFRNKKFRYGKKIGNKPHGLLVKQREILFNHTCKKPYMEKARKMMCIQAYSGCRYSDIKTFTPQNLKKKGFLVFTPIKTKRYDIVVDQPLHPNLDKLLKEVNYNTTEEYTTSNQKYDKFIPDVLNELKSRYPKAGFSDDYSSHNMRDTAISIWVKSGVNFKSVLKWAGLRKYGTLDHYVDIDDDFEQQEMKKTILED